MKYIVVATIKLGDLATRSRYWVSSQTFAERAWHALAKFSIEIKCPTSDVLYLLRLEVFIMVYLSLSVPKFLDRVSWLPRVLVGASCTACVDFYARFLDLFCGVSKIAAPIIAGESESGI